ncbi:helix-turn-helix domain-containing protein [Lactiplantibacillus plantarum]|uniref:helix-turn-helix domain-containing protein n=1 Tax=Lactiplantibacillus plantarum TaxID=1590 RepID=UPI0022B9D2C6|nr:helix-turn-helix domain-containing protein [Lactiplantibacillus plantarum]
MKNKSTQEKVVLELLTNLDTWVSGDYLAKKFQVSRETIWKAINNLKNKRDYPIVSRKKRGYMLHTAPYLEADLINIYRVDCKFNPNFWTNLSA